MKSKIPSEITTAIDTLIRLRIGHFDAHNQLHCMNPPKHMKKELKTELTDLNNHAKEQLHIIRESLARLFQ